MVNPAHVKAVKGHKTDAKDSARLAELLECGLLQGSYIPPPELKEVRDLTRLRTKKVQARTSDVQRLGKTLESAGIKLGSVASDITGKGPTAMIEALIDGERRGAVMADLAIGRARAKIADLSMALEGRFTDHHAMMCRLHLDAIALHDAGIADLERADRRQGRALAAGDRPAQDDPRVRRHRRLDLDRRDRPGPARVVRLRRQAGLLGQPRPGQLRQRRQAGLRPHRRGRHLHQARAGPGRLGRGQDTGPAAGPLQPPGPPHGRREEPRREEEGHRRDRAHPAQDRLLRPANRDPLPGARRRLLRPPPAARPPPGLAGRASSAASTPAAPSPSPLPRPPKALRHPGTSRKPSYPLPARCQSRHQPAIPPSADGSAAGYCRAPLQDPVFVSARLILASAHVANLK